ncbi:MAG: MCE family protein [Myxococcales bacterium]|nr:MCE family protein [Myxococcales bacterium]
MKKILTPFRVGLLVLASGVFLFVLLTFVKKGGLAEREALTVYAHFRDASGLGKKSRVQIAGIAVGEVKDIALEGTRAKVSLRIRRDVGLRQDASLTKRSESLLGDFLLDLYPGSESAPLMPEGGEIKLVIDAAGMEQVFNTLAQITADIQQVTSALREVLGGEKGAGSLQQIIENLIQLSATVDRTVRESAERLAEILKNFEGVSDDVRGITRGQEDTVRNIVHNIDLITKDTREVLATVKKVLGSGEGELKDSVASLKQTLNRLDATLANLEDVTRKVKEGHGPVGALLANERLGQRISESVEDLSDFTARLTQLEAEVGIKSDYLLSQGAAKNSLALRLIPRPDKYYLLEVVDDPRGSVETVLVQSNPPSSGDPVIQQRTITKDAVKFSAQFAKRFSFTTLRFGIIESTGGVGADFNFPLKFLWYSRWIEDALVIKVDAFNFSVVELDYPRIRATVRLVPYEHLFINAGVDDLLNVPTRDRQTNRLIAGRDFFVGAGLFFTDQDLKAILTAAPIPSP